MQTTYKLILGVVVVVVVAVGGWYAFSSGSGDELVKLASNPGTKLTEAQVDAVVARISKFMVVPNDERPSVVVLKDAAALAQQQAIFQDAVDGNILIVYPTRMIIYDAITNKLVGVGLVTQNTATPSPTPDGIASGSAQLTPTPSATPVAPEKVTIEVRNGTTTVGFAGKTASDLKKNAWVTSATANDSKGIYAATVIVDMSGGKNPGAIAALEKIFGVKAITTLPTGEAKTTANILVIVGK